MKRSKKTLKIIIYVFVLIALGIAVFILSHCLRIKKDLDRLLTEEYDTVFFAMYPTENYVEGDWMHFRAMDIVKTDYVIPNNKILQKYMDAANASGNAVTTVYLGVDPKKIAKEEVVLMIQQNPTILFEVVLAYPQITYWTDMSEEKSTELIQNYQTFAEWIIPLQNANIHFFSGEEWLVCNSKNYMDEANTNTQVSKFLMCNFDAGHPYCLNADTVQTKFEQMHALVTKYQEGAVAYPRAEDVDIVFFGDSIIGNYTDSLSVPEVVSGLLGAQVYNCGYGGKGAAQNELTPIAFPDIVEALINEDVSGLPQEAQVTQGMEAFFTREKKSKQLVFVVNYGLNDYFNGVPVATEDIYDISSYAGAMRLAVERLQDAYPEAQIILMTPNFTTYFECGQQKMSVQGGVLEEYAEAILSLANELEVDVLDNYHELPITLENWWVYQDDGCHLNERGRFLLGSRIAQKIKIE